MDTTPEYIRMCEKAWQDLGDPKISLINEEYQILDRQNLWARRYGHMIHFSFKSSRVFNDEIPIYQQDQLQEMINITPATFSNILSSIHYVRNKPPQSFEVMWLEIVMQKKYSKTWNDEKEGWEKIKEGRE